MRRPLISLLAAAVLGLLSAGSSLAADEAVVEALAARNPTLSDLRASDPDAFAAAVDIIAKAQAEAGVKTLDGAPTPPPLVERGIATDAGKEFTAGNPDVLWLYNAAPEGMQDLVSLLKSAGKKGKS